MRNTTNIRWLRLICKIEVGCIAFIINCSNKRKSTLGLILQFLYAVEQTLQHFYFRLNLSLPVLALMTTMSNVHFKTALKGVENPMFFSSQSAKRPPPISFLLQSVRAAYRPPFSWKRNYRLLGQEYHDYGLVVAQINGHPYEHRVIDKQFAKLIEKNRLRPVVFHSLRHSSTSLKLKLSRGNIKAVQGDTGHAEARMVTDTYAHGFDADRKLIAHEMDIGFFAKVGNSTEENSVSPDTIQQLRSLIQSHPELLSELLKGTDSSAEGTGNTAWMLASVGRRTISMGKSKNFVSRKFTVNECNCNQNIHFNRCKKGAKTMCFGSFGTPGQIRTADLSLRRRTLLSSWATEAYTWYSVFLQPMSGGPAPA